MPTACLRHDAIDIMNNVFQNESIVAAGGTVHITQGIEKGKRKSKMVGCIKNIIKFQVMQYLTSFYLYKYTQSVFNALIVISGAYGAFKRSMLVELKGYRRSVGEDMDITLKVHQYLKTSKSKYKMTYVPQSVCYTECPENLRNLTKQRIRWQKAFIDCTIKYGLRMFREFNPGVSCFFVFDSLILGTLTTMLFIMIPISIIMSSQISLIFIIFMIFDFLSGIVENVVSLLISERYQYHFSAKDMSKVFFFIPYMLVSYRYLNIFFVIIGTISYVINKDHWNRTERFGRRFYVAQTEDVRPHRTAVWFMIAC